MGKTHWLFYTRAFRSDVIHGWGEPGHFDPVATPLGLFLVGFGILLIVWSGAGLSYNSQTVSTLRDEREEARGTVFVKAQCPYCSASYSYHLRETDSARTVTCQNCGRQFELTE